MEQLKMYCLPDTKIKEFDLPDGYSISNYKSPEDKLAWCECCKNGLVADDADEKTFDDCITSRTDIDLYSDVFFIDYKGEHIGTVTAYIHSDDNTGDMHMVGIRKEFRGKGLAKYLGMITLKHLLPKHPVLIHLTTDDWRKPAIKSYLNAGFLPDKYDTGMQERWEEILKELNIESTDMLNNDGTYYKTIYQNSKD